LLELDHTGEFQHERCELETDNWQLTRTIR